MKTKHRIVAALGAAFLISAMAAQAQFLVDDIYVKGDLGGSILNDIHLKNGGGRIGTDPGVRGDVAFGSDLNPFLAAELEFGAMGNELHAPAGSPPTTFDHADLYQLPMLGNLIFKIPMLGGVTPYFGAGAGGVVSTLDLHSGRHNWADDSDVSFAYQAMAGVNVALNHHMEIGLGYKFLGTLDHTWFEGDPVLQTQTGKVFSHSILASFTFKF